MRASIAEKYLIADKMRAAGKDFENIGNNVNPNKINVLCEKIPPVLLIQQDIADFFAQKIAKIFYKESSINCTNINMEEVFQQVMAFAKLIKGTVKYSFLKEYFSGNLNKVMLKYNRKIDDNRIGLEVLKETINRII